MPSHYNENNKKKTTQDPQKGKAMKVQTRGKGPKTADPEMKRQSKTMAEDAVVSGAIGSGMQKIRQVEDTGIGSANMKPGSRQINTPGNFRADSAPQKFQEASQEAAGQVGVNVIHKRKDLHKNIASVKTRKGRQVIGEFAKSYGAEAAAGAVAGALGASGGVGAGVMLGAAGARTAGNMIQNRVAQKRVAKYGQKGSAIVPHTTEKGAKAVLGEKTYQGTASTISGMRKEARHYRKTVNKAVSTAKRNTKIAARNEKIAMKNEEKAKRRAIGATRTQKLKKNYRTTAQKATFRK